MEKKHKQIHDELNSLYYYLPCADAQGNDLYICNCGNIDFISPEKITYRISDDISTRFINNNYEDDHIKNFLSGKRILNTRCSRCGKDLSSIEVTENLQNIDTLFFERFYIEDKKDSLTLFCLRAGMNYNLNEKFKKILIKESYIKINKKSNKIFIKNFSEDKHIAITLSNVFNLVITFFTRNPETTYSDGYIFVHDWIGRVAKVIRDAKNMNIVEELLNYMIGKSGFDIIAKITVIFLSIILYPNLSTISLTKGNVFLFDLIANCDFPSLSYLRRKKATSPIKIFNTLIQLKNKSIQNKFDQEDVSKLDYINPLANKATTEIIKKIKEEKLNILNDAIHIKKNNGKVFIRDSVYKKSITPFWFSKIKKFSEYEQSMQWLRIVKFEQFIDLLNRYDFAFLLNTYKVLEFRDDLTFERIKQFLDLIEDHCIETFKQSDNEKIKNYDPVLSYNFNLFDDCYRMIEELRWDPKKVLFKIKKNKKLLELHENLIKHRSYISNSEINKRFIEFSNKFMFLEKYSENLDIHLEIKLISTPEQLMSEAIKMRNCAGSYVRKVANGQYIAFMVYDKSPKRAKDDFYEYMMVLEITPLGLEFVGIKSKFNKYGSNRFKEDVKKYLVDKDINFKDVPSIKTNIQSNESSYNGFFENIIKD